MKKEFRRKRTGFRSAEPTILIFKRINFVETKSVSGKGAGEINTLGKKPAAFFTFM